MPPSFLRSVLSRAGGLLDQGALRVMQGAMSRTGPRQPPRDARKRLIALAEHYAAADMFSPPGPAAAEVSVRAERRGARVLDVSFRSSYRPTFAPYREEFFSYDANLTARARLYTGERPAPVAICLHGWGGGPFFLEERAFPVTYLRRLGLDVALFQLPFHGARAPAQSPISGSLFPSAHVVRTNEGFGQAIHDLRALAAVLRERGAPAVGVMGMSLGGYTGALWAGLDDDLAFCVAMIPAVDMSQLMWRHGSNSALRRRAEKAGVTGALLGEVFAAHAPLRRPARIGRERLMVIAGEGDRIAPPSQARALWEHWQRPRIHWFPGGHLAQVGRGEAFRDLGRHLADLDLARAP